MPDTRTTEDHVLALTLISTWALLTGRRLRGVGLAGLNRAELIDFWADPQMECVPVVGGHNVGAGSRRSMDPEGTAC
ncbi:MAG: hypothetical protein ABIS86_01475 [Streptosporangiaceae bacterium]